jgi:hypothetical protein
MSVSSVFSWSPHNLQSANFIAEKWIINDNSLSPSQYNMDFKITRREMLKIMMNLSGKTVTDRCLWAFSDLNSSDWGCKYAEAAIKEWYIAANTTFRPNDNITQIESLKMTMQAVGMVRDSNDDWRAGYVSKASREKLIDDDFLDYDLNALRWWIFSNAARSHSNFKYSNSSVEIEDQAINELFNSLFDF